MNINCSSRDKQSIKLEFDSTPHLNQQSEIKFYTLIKKYQNAYDELELVFRALEKNPSSQKANLTLNKLNSLKITREKLESKNLISKPILDILFQHDTVLKQAEIFACKSLLSDSFKHPIEMDPIEKAHILEKNIEFREIFKKMRKKAELSLKNIAWIWSQLFPFITKLSKVGKKRSRAPSIMRL